VYFDSSRGLSVSDTPGKDPKKSTPAGDEIYYIPDFMRSRVFSFLRLCMGTCQDRDMNKPKSTHKKSSWAWNPAPKKLSLASNEIHVWISSLEVPAETERRLMAYVTPMEFARMHYQKNPQKKRQQVLSHAMLRIILSKYVNIGPAEMVFVRSESGKPALDATLGKTVSFSMSHSGGYAAYAVTKTFNVGVDVERLDEKRRYEVIAGRFFSESEKAHLTQRFLDERLRMFYRLWTAKEAVSKAVGTGLSYPLSQYEIALNKQGVLAVAALNGDTSAASRWSLRSWDLDGYAVACAVEGHPRTWVGYSLSERDLG